MKKLITLFMMFICVSAMITALYRCPSLSDHNNYKCDVCGDAGVFHYTRHGTEYELCYKHYKRWEMKDLCNAKYYQESYL